MKSRAYQALVRPQHEYSAEAWNPRNITTSDRLERIQRAAARFVHHDYRHTTSVNNLINILGWNRLHTRRLICQLTNSTTLIGKHDHQLKYAIPVASIDSCRFSFYPHSIRSWNQLPSTAVHADSPAAFQAIALPAVIEMKSPIGHRQL